MREGVKRLREGGKGCERRKMIGGREKELMWETK